jgi:hypothetical protein
MPPICRPASAHQWRFHGAVLGTLPGADDRRQVVHLYGCTQCPAALELSGAYLPGTRTVSTLEAWLWLAVGEPVPVVTQEDAPRVQGARWGRRG